jgi:hypothetical protein
MPDTYILLYFLVHLVLAAMRTILLEFQPLTGGLLVLGVGVVAVLALRTLESDYVARHDELATFIQ